MKRTVGRYGLAATMHIWDNGRRALEQCVCRHGMLGPTVLLPLAEPGVADSGSGTDPRNKEGGLRVRMA